MKKLRLGEKRKRKPSTKKKDREKWRKRKPRFLGCGGKKSRG